MCHGLDNALSYKVAELVYAPSARCVAKGPTSLFPDLKRPIVTQLYEERDQVGIDHLFDLTSSARGDIGHSPACLLARVSVPT
eukprot:CAMPEP_0175884732 /NCGR_PEP_ID=MMETSP0107_2-20121207/44687_1 /TAXON_ID=195067 ORGANISM="Goniomonas pacifica, Strain CCMP1869" /NCGR_SAMPLE_ID=MMETSP0107_2 /ASSEMBLY_ACC=CAM_ASM_000203 /LENGTH=82 /DNA_ID=CAMNT_0017204921 /DNA_START=173 /DNA_END=421 /DNA_ORIENTATION=+